jgi:hypothetical protein
MKQYTLFKKNPFLPIIVHKSLNLKKKSYYDLVCGVAWNDKCLYEMFISKIIVKF